MAFPMLDDKPVVEEVKKDTNFVASRKWLAEKTPGFMEQLTTLVMVSWYFFFSGLAVLFGRNVPKWWVDMGRKINRQKVAETVEKEVVKVSGESKPNKFKVVDLETNKPFSRPNGTSVS